MSHHYIIIVLHHYRLVPIIEKLKESHHKTMKRYSSAVNNEIGLLKKCLDALFENKIYEARRYIPFITQSFKIDAVARLFVPELVHRLTVYGGFLGQEQFDILVKLMNSAMAHEPMAARLLPLSTAFYRVSSLYVSDKLIFIASYNCIPLFTIL